MEGHRPAARCTDSCGNIAAPDSRFPQPPSWKNELRQLAPGVFAYVQAGGPGLLAQGVSNAGVIVGDDHVMVHRHHGLRRCMPRALHRRHRKAAGDKPFRRLINTHHHGDHVNGNQFFGPIEIVSHPYCRDEVRKAVAEPRPRWDKREGWADGNEERKLVPPTTTFDGKTIYHYGDSPVEVRYRWSRAHLRRPYRLLPEVQDSVCQRHRASFTSRRSRTTRTSASGLRRSTEF